MNTRYKVAKGRMTMNRHIAIAARLERLSLQRVSSKPFVRIRIVANADGVYHRRTGSPYRWTLEFNDFMRMECDDWYGSKKEAITDAKLWARRLGFQIREEGDSTQQLWNLQTVRRNSSRPRKLGGRR